MPDKDFLSQIKDGASSAFGKLKKALGGLGDKLSSGKKRRKPREKQPEGAREPKVVAYQYKQHTGCLSGFLYFGFVILISAIIAGCGWLFASDLFAFSKPPLTANVTIPENYTIDQVADTLKDSGLIEYKWLFKLFAKVSHADQKIDAGTYELDTTLDYRAIVSHMRQVYSRQFTDVTIIEGLTLTEIFNQLEKEGICSASKLAETAKNYDFNYAFLDKATLGQEKRLEGYLFPDTYTFYLEEDPVYVIEKFLDNFDYRVTDDMYRRAEALGYSMHDIITVASLIEKETAGAYESATIASVIYNRLEHWAIPLLQIDATIQYILPERKEQLTDADLAIDSPYNTYRNAGLPPAAIANPGLSSIEAALNPANTSYYFYALHKEGHHSFFTNASDFNAFVSGENYGG